MKIIVCALFLFNNIQAGSGNEEFDYYLLTAFSQNEKQEITSEQRAELIKLNKDKEFEKAGIAARAIAVITGNPCPTQYRTASGKLFEMTIHPDNKISMSLVRDSVEPKDDSAIDKPSEISSDISATSCKTKKKKKKKKRSVSAAVATASDCSHTAGGQPKLTTLEDAYAYNLKTVQESIRKGTALSRIFYQQTPDGTFVETVFDKDANIKHQEELSPSRFGSVYKSIEFLDQKDEK